MRSERRLRAARLLPLGPAALALLAGGLRWLTVRRRPLGPDAADLAAVAAHPTLSDLLHSAAPGWVVGEALVARLVGTHTSLLRILSLVTLVAAVVAFQMVATRLAGRTAGQVAAAVLALLPGLGVAAVDGGPELALATLLLLFAASLVSPPRWPRPGRSLRRSRRGMGPGWPQLASAALLLLMDWRTLALTAPLMLAVRLSSPARRALAVAAGIAALALIRVGPLALRIGPNAIHDWNDALAAIPLSAARLALLGDPRRIVIGVPDSSLLASLDLLLAGAFLFAAVLLGLRLVPTRHWPLAALSLAAAAYLLRIPAMEPVTFLPVLPLAALAAIAPTAAAGRLWPAVTWRPALAVVAAAAIVFAVSAYARLQYIQAGPAGECSDTCILTQALWNAAHGNGLRVTTWFGFDSLLAQHAFLNQWLLVPVYYLWPDPIGILFATQSIALAAAGVAGFAVARALGADPLESAAVGLMALVHPSLAGTSTGYALGQHFYGYHPDSVFPVLFLLAYLAYLRRSWPALGVLGALSISTHEAYSLVWIGVGAIWFLRGQRRLGAAAAATAAAWLLFVTRVLIPSAAHGANPYYFFAFASHGWGAVLTIAGAAVNAAATQLLTWGGLPLFSPLVLAGLPNLLIDASAAPGGYLLPVNIASWHSMAFVPLMVIATATALVRIRTWRPRLRGPALAGCALVGLATADLSGSLYAHLPAPDAKRNADLAWMAARVPDGASMGVPESVGGPFAGRRDFYIEPSRYHDPTASDYVLVDLKAGQEDPAAGPSMIQVMTNSPDFDLIAACDGLYLYHHHDRGAVPASFGDSTGAGARCSRIKP